MAVLAEENLVNYLNAKNAMLYTYLIVIFEIVSINLIGKRHHSRHRKAQSTIYEEDSRK